MRYAFHTALLSALFLGVVDRQSVYAHGELEIRIASATRQIERATNNLGKLYLERGELHREHQDWEAAKSDYALAEQLDPGLGVDFFRARMLAAAGEPKAARVTFDRVLARSPDHGEARVGRARTLVVLGDRTAAIADFQRGLEALREPKPEYFLELAQALAAEQRVEEALRILDKGHEGLVLNVMLQAYALDLELEQKNVDAALRRIDSIIAQSPRQESWLARRGTILLAAGQMSQARKSFEASLKAMDRLPRLLRQAPPMQELQSRVHAALAEIKEN